MSNIIQVLMGEMAVGQDNIIFSTGGVGSCLVICMFDKERKIGGLAHSMLPRKKDVANANPKLDSEAKYVDNTIEKMVTRLVQLGASREKLSVKLVGGATMFHVFQNKAGKSIGEQNIETAHEELRKHRLALIGEDVGGTSGKMVDFNLANGILNVNLKI